MQATSTPHPNQVRSACERCRRQKLRCLRAPDSGPSCARCTRLGFPCQSGSQRKVGRPPKSDALRRRSAATATGTTPSLELVASNSPSRTRFSRIEDITDEPITVDWSPPAGAPFSPVQVETIFLDEPWFVPRELEPPDPGSGEKEVRCSDAVFQSLSKIHVELRDISDIWTRHAAHMDFDTFFCTDHMATHPIVVTRAILQIAQEFLMVLKAMHNRVGTRPHAIDVPPQQPHGVRSGWTWSPMITYLSSSGGHSGDDEVGASAVVIDAPAAFLVVSCFVMLVKSLENLFAMTHARLNDLSDGPIRSGLKGHEMMFIDIPIVEFSLQGILFAEGTLHLMSQINVLIGFPSRWSGRSIWTGLLSTRRYRELLNKELGYVEGLWSTRPFRLTETIIMTKDLLQELAMMGYA